jgi:hypothetical protein
MMLLPLTQCLRVDQLRASFQKHVSEIVRNINDSILQYGGGYSFGGKFWTGRQGKGASRFFFFSENYFHVGTTVPLKAARVALNLVRLFSTIFLKTQVFAGLTGPNFF